MTKIKLITYNIDCLPSELDLRELPWIFKPFVWIYKWIKGTTIVTINDNGDKNDSIGKICKYLNESNADIIAVQEDFNYHDSLLRELNYEYHFGKYTGGFFLHRIFRDTEWWSRFPFPRFKCDGLGLLTRRLSLLKDAEKIVRWNKSYGYFGHANDKLTHKGYRRYIITERTSGHQIIVFVIHMDADFYDAEKCPDISKDINARKNQLQQIVGSIKDLIKLGINYPIVIMGDTNSSCYKDWDINNIKENLIDPINEIPSLCAEEIIPSNFNDVDRIFYVNNDKVDYFIKPIGSYYDMDAGLMSDHYPFIAEIELSDKKQNSNVKIHN